jgi:hypothetical protein
VNLFDGQVILYGGWRTRQVWIWLLTRYYEAWYGSVSLGGGGRWRQLGYRRRLTR